MPLNLIKLLSILLLCMPCAGMSATWTKLDTTPQSTLWLDKSSIASQNQYQKAWLKIQYQEAQINRESVEEKAFNISKSLVFFDCAAKVSATTQVFQYEDSILIYSAGVNVSNAEFIEPVPESEVAIAMEAVCRYTKTKADQKARAAAAKQKREAAALAAKNAEASEKGAKSKKSRKKPVKKAEKPPEKAAPKPWGYAETNGPTEWAKLNDTFTTCSTGFLQSPIDITTGIAAKLKRIKTVQKYTAKDISNIGHTIQMHFNKGNIMTLDTVAYELQHVDFHSPSEHTIDGVQYPLAAHFIHTNAAGEVAIIAVLFKEGKRNRGIAKLLDEAPKEAGDSKKVESRIKPRDFMPVKKSYYRFTGSLTTPPCTEGVRWIVMKSASSISKKQLSEFKSIMQAPNNRPTQPLNGRIILE